MTNTSPATTLTGIPSFALYGERHQSSQPELVHIEDIATRSRQHDWLIKPHRHNHLFQLLCLFDGSMRITLDESRSELAGNWLISIPPGHVHGFQFPADTQGVVLTVFETLLSAGEQPQLQPYFDQLLRLPHCIVFDDNDPLLTQLRQLFIQIRRELAQRDTGHTLMLRWLVKMVLMTLKRQIEKQPGYPSTHIDRGKQAVFKFRTLLDQQYARHWTAQDYAQALHLSPSTLNRLCKRHLGTSTKEAIQHRLLLEIKRRLIYTRESHEKIAYALGFKDPAYFSRYFRKLEGISPSDYRHATYQQTGTHAYRTGQNK